MIAGGASRWAFPELARAARRAALEASVRIALMICLPPLEAEDPNNATLTGMSCDVRHERSRRTDVGGVIRQHVPGKQEPVTAEPRIYGHVLLAIGPAERDGIADHAGTHLELG